MIATDFKAPSGLLRDDQFPNADADTLLGAWLSQAAAQIALYANEVTLSTQPITLEGVVYANETDALTAAYVYWRAFEYLCQHASERPVSVRAGSVSATYQNGASTSYCLHASSWRAAWLSGTGQGLLLPVF